MFCCENNDSSHCPPFSGNPEKTLSPRPLLAGPHHFSEKVNEPHHVDTIVDTIVCFVKFLSIHVRVQFRSMITFQVLPCFLV